MRINYNRYLLFILTIALIIIIISALHEAGADPEYHPYHEVVQDIESVADDHPDIVRLYNLTEEYGVPLTHQNRSVLAVRITDRDWDPVEPEVLITGCHHAREWISVEVPLHFIHYLVDNYGTDPYVTYLVDNRDIWIIPVLNPDGYIRSWEQNDRANNGSGWRKNCCDNNEDGKIDGNDGVDPNRNYGYKWGYDNSGSSSSPSSNTYRGPSPFSEPETQAIRALSLDHDFGVVIHYHSYGNLVLFPWAYRNADTPDHDTFVRLGEQMALYNGYTHGNTNDGIIYKCNGEATDWHYANRSSFAFTVELGSSKDRFIPDESRIIPICEENLQVNLFACLAADNPRKLEGFADPEEDADSSGLWDHSGPGDHWAIVPGGAIGGYSWYTEVQSETETHAELTLNISLINEGDPTFLTFWEKYDLMPGSDAGVFLKDKGGEYTRLEEYIPGQGTRGPISDWKLVHYNLTPHLDSSPRTLSFILDSSSERAGDYWYFDGIRITSAPPFECTEQEGNGCEYNFSIDPEYYDLEFLPDTTHTIPVNITNDADENNTIDFSGISNRTGWELNLTVDGKEGDNVTLTPHKTIMVNITLHLPEEIVAGQLGNYQIDFRSRENTSQSRTLLINVTIRLFYHISLEDQADEYHFIPGQEEDIHLILHNHGNSRVEIRLDFTINSGDDKDWDLSLPQFDDIDPYSDKDIPFTIKAPARIAAGTELGLEVSAAVKGQSSGPVKDTVDVDLIVDEYVDAGFVLPGSREAVPGEDNEFVVQLVNHGNERKTFDLSATSEWNAVLSVLSKQLDAYRDSLITLTLTPPESIYPGEQESVNLKIWLDGSLVNSMDFTFTSIESYAVEIDTNDRNLTIPSGGKSTASLKVYNKGNSANTVILEESDPPGGFIFRFSKTELLLQAFSEYSVDLEITAPSSKPSGLIYIITVKAVSDNDPEKEDAVDIEVTIGRIYGVELSIDKDDREQETPPGEKAEFIITVENTGNGRTVMSLSLSGIPNGWAAELDLVNYEITLDSGQNRLFRLTVTLPPGAKNKDEAEIKVTARCGDDGSGYESSYVTVTIVVKKHGSDEGISVLYVAAGILIIAFIGILGFIVITGRKEDLTSFLGLSRTDRMPHESGFPSLTDKEGLNKALEKAGEKGPAPGTQNVECPHCKARFDVELPITDKKTIKTMCLECGAIFSFEREERKEEVKEEITRGKREKLAPGTQNVECPHCKARFDVELPITDKKTIKTMCLECGAIFSFEREERKEDVKGEIEGKGEEAEKREEKGLKAVIIPGLQNVECPYCNARFDVELPEGGKKTIKTMCVECSAIFSFERKEPQERPEAKPQEEPQEEAREKAWGEVREEAREEPQEKAREAGLLDEDVPFEETGKGPPWTEEELALRMKSEKEYKKEIEEKKRIEGETRAMEKREERFKKIEGPKEKKREERLGTRTSIPIKTKEMVGVKKPSEPLSLKVETPSSGVTIPKVMKCPNCGHKVFLKGKEEKVKCIFCGTIIMIKRERKRKMG